MGDPFAMSHFEQTTPPLAVAIMGYGGLVPFWFCAVMAWVAPGAPMQTLALEAGAIWAAIIANFMAAVHWGLALRRADVAPAHYAWSIAPAIILWPFMLANVPVLTLGACLVIFPLILVADRRIIAAGHAPGWYARLRWPLTIGVMAAIILMLVRAAGS